MRRWLLPLFYRGNSPQTTITPLPSTDPSPSHGPASPPQRVHPQEEEGTSAGELQISVCLFSANTNQVSTSTYTRSELTNRNENVPCTFTVHVLYYHVCFKPYKCILILGEGEGIIFFQHLSEFSKCLYFFTFSWELHSVWS